MWNQKHNTFSFLTLTKLEIDWNRSHAISLRLKKALSSPLTYLATPSYTSYLHTFLATSEWPPPVIYRCRWVLALAFCGLQRRAARRFLLCFLWILSKSGRGGSSWAGFQNSASTGSPRSWSGILWSWTAETCAWCSWFWTLPKWNYAAEDLTDRYEIKLESARFNFHNFMSIFRRPHIEDNA